MDKKEIVERIKLLEYHQSLLLQMISQSKDEFYKLIIEKGIGEEEVRKFHKHCDDLSKKLQEQKAEGFVYFYPLFKEFTINLPPEIKAEEAINACLKQGLYISLMSELKKYL